MSTEKKDTIDDFEGFEEGQDNFFGETFVEGPGDSLFKEENEKSQEPEKTEGKEKPKKEDKPEEKEEDFFTEEDEVKEEKSPDKESDNISMLEKLKEKGLINYELEEGEELDEEKAEELLEESWSNSLQDTVKQMTEDLPEEVKGLIKFTAKGGSTEEYFQSLQKLTSSSITEKSDIEDVKVQKNAIKEDLKSQGYDDDYISDHVDVLEEKGKLSEIAKKSYDKIISKKKEFSKKKEQEIEEANKERKRKSKEFKEGIKEFVSQNKKVRDLNITDKDKKDLPSYISDPVVELSDGRKVSQAQADIIQAMGDKESLVVLAKVAKSGFDIKKLAKSLMSETEQKRRENLSHSRNSSKGGNKKKKVTPLWEAV